MTSPTISSPIFPPIYIAIQGIPGSYSEQAARSYFSRFLNLKINFIYTQSFPDLIQALDPDFVPPLVGETGLKVKPKAREGADPIFGVIPIENSTTGFVTPAQEVLNQNLNKLKLLDQIICPIQHALLAHPDIQNMNQIKTAISHPQALAQCANFLKSRNIIPQEFFDTAGAAQALSQTYQNDTAAIASIICAEIYGLKILEENIQDLKNNQTRFLIITPLKNNINNYLEKHSEILNLTQKSILNSAEFINTRAFLNQ